MKPVVGHKENAPHFFVHRTMIVSAEILSYFMISNNNRFEDVFYSVSSAHYITLFLHCL